MTLTLDAVKRDVIGKKVFALRKEGKIPAVIFGHNFENQNIAIDYVPFEKAYAEAGENTIVDLMVDGKMVKVIIADVQHDPVNGKIAHADLKHVDMNEKITANVEFKFIGESRLVKEEGGSLISSLSEVEVKCLPKDLIHEIDIDISVLADFDDVIKISDLKLPAGIEIVDQNEDDIVVMVARPRVEVEEAPAPVAEAEAPKTEEKKEEAK